MIRFLPGIGQQVRSQGYPEAEPGIRQTGIVGQIRHEEPFENLQVGQRAGLGCRRNRRRGWGRKDQPPLLLPLDPFVFQPSHGLPETDPFDQHPETDHVAPFSTGEAAEGAPLGIDSQRRMMVVVKRTESGVIMSLSDEGHILPDNFLNGNSLFQFICIHKSKRVCRSFCR